MERKKSEEKTPENMIFDGFSSVKIPIRIRERATTFS